MFTRSLLFRRALFRWFSFLAVQQSKAISGSIKHHVITLECVGGKAKRT